MKALDQTDACQDENAARDERAHNSPEQNTVLQLAGHAKVTEDNQENEKIVDAERELDYVPGGKFEALGASMPEVDENGKRGCEADPHGAPAEGLAKTHRVHATVEDAQIKRQHHQHKDVKKNPEE